MTVWIVVAAIFTIPIIVAIMMARRRTGPNSRVPVAENVIPVVKKG